MDNFYSANGNFSKINIIESFEPLPPSNVSLISYMIENEQLKLRVNELESNLTELSNKLAQLRLNLPYRDNKTSKIITFSNNNWLVNNGNIYIEIDFEEIYESVPQVFTQLVEKNISGVVHKLILYDLTIKGFKCKLTINNFDINRFKLPNGENKYSDKMDYVKDQLSINYLVI